MSGDNSAALWATFRFPAAGLSIKKCSDIQNRLVSRMYKGDIFPAEAHKRLTNNPDAVLIDVRTEPEWAFVGVPAVERLIQLSWQQYPVDAGQCRFRARDRGERPRPRIPNSCSSAAPARARHAAAAALTAAGFTNCWNVAEGFEGDRDATGHRGTVGGWKAAGLPWIQS